MSQRGRAVPGNGSAKPVSKSKGGRKKKGGKKGGKRWFLGVDKFNLGPVNVEGFGMGSGARSVQSQAPGAIIRTNEEAPSIQKSMIHTRREQIGVINGNTGFGLVEYALNPGNTTLFPWLSQIAPLYEKYLIRRLSICFIQTGSGFAAPNVSGRVVLGCDYDVMSPPVGSLAEAENKDPNIGFAPYEVGVLVLDPRLMNPEPKYVRGAAYPPGGDPKSYDGGKVFVAVAGTPNTAQLGILYVEYDVELITPQLPQLTSFIPDYHAACFSGGAGSVYATGIRAPLQALRVAAPQGGSLTLPFDAATDTWTMTAGLWYISGAIIIQGSTNQISRLTVELYVNGVLLRIVSDAYSTTNNWGRVTAALGQYVPFNNGDQLTIQLTVTSAAGVNSLLGDSIICFRF